jgi:small subunit ribosomal protein S6
MLAMRAYELMVILDSGLEDEAIEANLSRLVDQVGARGASVKTQDRCGRRGFAFEIDHKHDGYYAVLEFVGGDDLDQLERSLRLADEVVRHKLLRLPDSEAARRGLVEGSAAPAPAG